MGATNTTANYNLSQFIGTDKPAWLQDYNGDMLKIDTGINAAKVAADGAQNAAGAAQNDATTANNAITNTITPAISSLNTTVGNQGGAINTINSLIGNGTPTTTDQTIIGAINEINAEITKLLWSGNQESGSMSISVPGIESANLIVICMDGGAGDTALILTRTDSTHLYGGGGEITAAGSQSMAATLAHAGNSVTNIGIRTSAATTRNIKAIYKLY